MKVSRCLQGRTREEGTNGKILLDNVLIRSSVLSQQAQVKNRQPPSDQEEGLEDEVGEERWSSPESVESVELRQKGEWSAIATRGLL